MSAEETVLNLFDSYWFECGVFAEKPPLSTEKTSAPDPQVQEDDDQEPADEKPNLTRITTLMKKSKSDQFLSSKDCPDSPHSPWTPQSVLGPHLQTILSGKEVESFQDSVPGEEDGSSENNSCLYESQTMEPPFYYTEPERSSRNARPLIQEIRRKKKKSRSRSLSELEFEELKGFMDLGFVFSDKDKDSNLVSIIPGLQRLGKNGDESDKGFGGASVSRPYLSEAWDSLEYQKEQVKNPLGDWRIPAFGNEMELKDHLRCWAHSVASTVR